MICTEFVFVLEIILGFFLQETDEEGIPLNQSLSQVSQNYLKNKFLFDVFILIPLGEFCSTLIH